MGICRVCGKRFTMMSGGEWEYNNTKIELCNSCFSWVKEAKNIVVDSPEEAKRDLDKLIQKCEEKYTKELLENYCEEITKEGEKIKQCRIEEQQVRQQVREEELEARKLRAERRSTLFESVRKMKITTGYDFHGYRITDYKGLASGEVVLGTGFISEWSAGISDFFGTQSGAFADKMIQAKNGAIKKLMEDAHLKGGNALIGVDFDYITFSNNILGVSANGTVVVIEEE